MALPEAIHESAASYLLGPYNIGMRQEHLCFGLWRPSHGMHRKTAMVHQLVLPLPDEVLLTGNVAFAPHYLERVADLAASSGSGVVCMHNHFGPGWQDMSDDDIVAERRTAPFAMASTGIPLVGMTLATDESWSARWWPRIGPRSYGRSWCRNVRVVGGRLDITWHPELAPPPGSTAELTRTIHAWGADNQSQLARTHVAVVGLGSVGRIVAECLARGGVERATLIDFDRMDRVNLDRQIGARRRDATTRRWKVEVAKEGFLAASTAHSPSVTVVRASVTEPEGLAAALDCDAIFCCVDRPWGRRVLNHVAYAHLIPVIDGGIMVRTKEGRFKGAEWSCRTAAPGRCCLVCAGSYDPGKVDEERRGILDDPSYFQGLPENQRRHASQNVLPFSMSLGAHQYLQFVALVTGLLDQYDLGEQRFHYNLGEVQTRHKACATDCGFHGLTASGDTVYPREAMTGVHPAAEAMRRA